MKNRCSPEALLSIIFGMSKEQKESVRFMGFGCLLKMKIIDIPLKLGFYVLQNFDSERMVIDIEGKELKVTIEYVHDMLGIPIGGTKLTQLDQWPKDDTSYDEWKQQFKKYSIIRLSAIKKVIISTTQADFNFKLNFLILFVNTFCESISMGRCSLFPLSYISRKTDISNIDWCSYVLDCLVRTKNSYIPYSDTSFFVGPSTFLVAYESKISKMLNSFERMKEKLNSKLNGAITKFPEKESFRIFEENTTNIINEEKTEGTTIFEFPKNERIKNNGDNNQKEGETEVKEKDGKNNQNDNDEEKKADDNEETNNHDETIQPTENKNLLDKVVYNIVDNVLVKVILLQKRKNQKVYMNKEQKLKKQNEMIQKQIKDDHQKVVIRLAKKNVLNPNPIFVSIPTEVGPSKHDLDQPREKKLADSFKSPFKRRITDTKPKLTHQESIACEWLFNLQGNTLDVVVQTKYVQITEIAVMESL
ncbi:unnamed protein product [Lactuca saligna]|uniref:Uncharacterized protein n=1 Tax=Lactuca saligna TaxID=75948 RepID=A0AA35YX17_LACSI|nr:unnamed protein product [Lactuca saligna]